MRRMRQSLQTQPPYCLYFLGEIKCSCLKGLFAFHASTLCFLHVSVSWMLGMGRVSEPVRLLPGGDLRHLPGMWALWG